MGKIFVLLFVVLIIQVVCLEWILGTPQKPPKNQRGLSTVKLYYFPFKGNTYSALTPMGIQNSSDAIINPAPTHKTLNSINSLLRTQGSNGKFNKSLTRLRVDWSKTNTVLVDQNGVVKIADKQYTLSKTNFVRLEKILNTLYDKQPEQIEIQKMINAKNRQPG